MTASSDNQVPSSIVTLQIRAEHYQRRMLEFRKAKVDLMQNGRDLADRFVLLLTNTEPELANKAYELLRSAQSPLLVRAQETYSAIFVQIASLHTSAKQEYADQAISVESFLALDKEFRRNQFELELAYFISILYQESANVNMVSEMDLHSSRELEALSDTYIKTAPAFSKELENLYRDRSKLVDFIFYFNDLDYPQRIEYLESLFHVYHQKQIPSNLFDLLYRIAEQSNLRVIYKPQEKIPQPAFQGYAE